MIDLLRDAGKLLAAALASASLLTATAPVVALHRRFHDFRV